MKTSQEVVLPTPSHMDMHGVSVLRSDANVNRVSVLTVPASIVRIFSAAV